MEKQIGMTYAQSLRISIKAAFLIGLLIISLIVLSKAICGQTPPPPPAAEHAPQSYIGAGFGFGYSNEDFEPRPIEVFGVAQKSFFARKLAVRGQFGWRDYPLFPTLFQE